MRIPALYRPPSEQPSPIRPAAQFDALGRLQRVVEAITYITDHSYDVRGSLVSVLQRYATGRKG